MTPQGGSVLARWATHAPLASGPTHKQTKLHRTQSAHNDSSFSSSALIRLPFSFVQWGYVWKSYLDYASWQFLIFEQPRYCLMTTEQLKWRNGVNLDVIFYLVYITQHERVFYIHKVSGVK